MFEGLRKRFSDFIDGLSKKEEGEEAQESTERKEKKGKAPDVTLTTKIKGRLLGKVKIGENDAEPFLEQLRVALLETDVNYDVSEKVVGKIHDNLVGKEIPSQSVAKGVREEIRKSILEILGKNAGTDILAIAKAKKSSGELPFKILFLGPNGAGKTTTIAKIAYMLNSNGIKCVISASDTFRAAAIEQAVIHANRLGVDVIKGKYGADPASIAFDAIAYAKAHGIDAVLIDSAGRQETNKSLVEELKKMARVNKPDLCIFIGEGIAGNALLEQVKQFNEAVRLDGVILTKLDADAKGGNTLSILSDTSVPVLYFGTGEKYTDLVRYNPEFVVDNIVSN